MTFIELIIGIGLLIVGAGGLLMGMPYVMFQMDYLKHSQSALNAAQGQLDALSATTFDTLWTGSQFAGARASGQTVAFTLEPNAPASRQGLLGIQIKTADVRTPNNPNLLDIQVAACWVERGRQIGQNSTCTNGAGWVTSPIVVSTRMGRRDA